MSNSLLNASVFDDLTQTKSKKISKSISLLSTTELDGSTPTKLFTVLCLAKHYSEDQQINVWSFTLLYELLLTLPSRGLMIPAPVEEGPLSISLATLRDRVHMDGIREVALMYCLHLLEQAEVRKKCVIQSTNKSFSQYNFAVSCLPLLQLYPLKSSYDCGLQDTVSYFSVRFPHFIVQSIELQ